MAYIDYIQSGIASPSRDTDRESWVALLKRMFVQLRTMRGPSVEALNAHKSVRTPLATFDGVSMMDAGMGPGFANSR